MHIATITLHLTRYFLYEQPNIIIQYLQVIINVEKYWLRKLKVTKCQVIHVKKSHLCNT